MYKVMIVDDDISLREHLKSMIEWNALDLELVCEAGDSETARELYLVNHPQIIITDINIPIITGLELAKELIENDPDIKFLIITGYSDFEYVREAVSLGAVDLLLKPLLPENVNDSLRKIIKQYNDLRKEQASKSARMQLLKENLPMLQEKYAAWLLDSHLDIDVNAINSKLSLLEMDIRGDNYAVCIIHLGSLNNDLTALEKNLLLVKKNTEDILLRSRFKRFTFYDDIYKLNCIISWESQSGGEDLEDCMNLLSERLYLLLDTRVYIGIGQPISKIEMLGQSSKQAKEALGYFGVLENETVINYKNVASIEPPVIIKRMELLESISRLFRANNKDELASLVVDHFAEIMSETNPLQQAWDFALFYITSIFSATLSLGIKIDDIPDYSDIISRMLKIDSLNQIKKYLLELTAMLFQALFEKRAESKNRLISLAKEYVKKNLGNESLGLGMVSYEIGLSPVYFCKLFRMEEGINFNDYLNEQRIKMAKKMLMETSMKVFEVSYSVGYSNPQYFNRVFKRIAKCTPLEYKRLLT